MESSLCDDCGDLAGGNSVGNVIIEAIWLAIRLARLTQPTQNISILPLDIESAISTISSLLMLANI